VDCPASNTAPVNVRSSATFSESLLGPDKGVDAAQFEELTAGITQQMAADFRAKVEAALADDADAGNSVMLLASHNLQGPGSEYPETGPLITAHSISNVQVFVEPGGLRVQVAFEQRGDLNVLQHGAPARVPLRKTATYWMTTGENGTWLLDGSDG
jgi:hypothetical protein